VAQNSRLSCQIPVTQELDGLIVRMPLSQHKGPALGANIRWGVYLRT
jgi:hypothetical protein